MAKKKATAEPVKLYRLVSINRTAGLVTYLTKKPETYDEAIVRLAAAAIFPGQVLKLEESTVTDTPVVRKLGKDDVFTDPPG